MKSNSISQRMGMRLPKIVLLLCILQPFMDVLSFWLDWNGLPNSVTLLLRLAVLLFMLVLGFLVSSRKRYYYIMLGILSLFTLCHAVACRHMGYLDPLGDLTNLVRIYQLPLTVLAFVSYLRANSSCRRAIGLGFACNLCIIALIELLSLITGTNPYTYPNKSIGLLGWFYFANSQSGILSMIVPVAIAYVGKRSRMNPYAVTGFSLLGFTVLYFFGTRLAYGALLGTAAAFSLGFLLLKLIRREKTGRFALLFLVFTLAAVLLFPLSPTNRNSQRVLENRGLKQADVEELVALDRAEALEEGLTGDALELASLQSAYEKYLPGPTGRFGLERTADLYDRSTDIRVIGDERLQKLNYCRLLQEDQPLSRLFGLELEEMVHDGITYDVENDFHGIYYLCGAVGLGLMLLFLLWFLLRILLALIRDFKGHFTFETISWGVALVCGLAHVYFTAGILRRPNASFYLALVLAAVYALTQNKTNETEVPQ